ncbi:MAG: hypothetical protein AAGF47_10140 [Planctomycetota bacterium]
MSQFGMNMPGGRRAKRGGLDVYSGLLCFAVLALGAATALMYIAATKVSPESGNPIALQETGRVQLPR